MRNSVDHNLPGAGFSDPRMRSHCKFNSRGVALVITLLLLFLLSIIGLAAVMSSSSDMMINGYYKSYRGSFYAADSGVNLARQAIYNYFNTQANAPGTWPSSPAVATTAGSSMATGVMHYVNGLYGTNASLNGYGNATSSVPMSFKVTTTVTPPTAAQPVGTTEYTYAYTYTLTAQGNSRGSENAQIVEKGAITVILNQGSGTSTTTASFAAFGAFIDSFSSCQGALVQGYMTGPMYARGRWNLSTGSSPGYTFTDPVSQTDAQISYYDGGTCVNSASVPYTFSDRNTVNPSFQSGLNLSSPVITPPANSFGQEWAVLDGKGCGTNEGTTCGSTTGSPSSPTQANLNAVLKNVSQSSYPAPSPTSTSPGTTSGVFLPYTCSGGACSLNSNAGGLYIEGGGPSGAVSTTLTLSTTNGAGGSSNPSGQVISVAQTGSSSTSTGAVTQTSSPSCTSSTRRGVTTYTCTAGYQQVTTANTPTTITNVTVDSVAGTTTVASYVQTSTGTTTATTTASCSGSSPCSPAAPSSISGGSTANSTTNSATTTLNLSGVPENLLTSPPQAATMIYVDGDVSVSGPSSGAAIQNNSMMNLTTNGDVTQTGNILYAAKPVTTTANQNVPGSNPACCSGSPADTLIPGNQNMNQVLGIFTANGNFILSPSTSGADIETDASVCMLSAAGETNSSIGHMATGNSVGKWVNIGGRMENRAASVSMTSSNIYFDRRFQSRPNFAPPWFPSTTVATSVLSSTVTAGISGSVPSRTTWQYVAGQ